MGFSDELMIALANWQKGWEEKQEKRQVLASDLLNVVQNLDERFKRVSSPCYRKRFLHRGELEAIFLKDNKDEGVVSWTIHQEFAERFKGLLKPDAVSGAIFEHTPSENEIVVNICELWKDADFIEAANNFKKKYPIEAQPLFHFKDTQGEVILMSPLKASEIIAFTGASSPFDDLCEQLSIPEGSRDELFKKLVQTGLYPGELKYTSKEGAQRVVENSIQKLYAKFQEYKK
ncbi:hypothetical protein [Acinetobacter johnsonii]|uniref:hypothetical protein n=1 Tax=Acinetobacter johnsonii TaxID=40214 RepID=UPI001F32EA0F|nr:hypothetical protein [Acinetobacter johnsonii]UIP95249.1 hypothetical protein LXM48_00100 [Acinetobacter johnsonii]